MVMMETTILCLYPNPGKVLAPKMLSRSRFSLFAATTICAVLAFGYGSARFGLLQAASSVLPDSAVVPIAVAQEPAVKSTQFAPNYATDLLNLRRWQKEELIIHVSSPEAKHNPCGRDYAIAMQAGVALWKPHVNGILNVRFTEIADEADIRVSFVPKGTLPDGAIGRTEVTYRNRDNVIVSATVRIDRTLKSSLLAQVAAHEFGHAFGMEGHSVVKNDLMYARAHLPATITQRDANTLHLNYSLEAARADATPGVRSNVPDVARVGSRYSTATACSLPDNHVH
ncbi:MAG: matrixin family metalloprotease [Fibrella sp.]|nr:matrixin family metalloprotease [Armatimonadota bacterium]